MNVASRFWKKLEEAPVNAGTYKATVTVGEVTAGISYEILQAEPDYTIPTGLTGAFGQTLADVTFPQPEEGTWKWKTPASTKIRDGSGLTRTVPVLTEPTLSVHGNGSKSMPHTGRFVL